MEYFVEIYNRKIPVYTSSGQVVSSKKFSETVVEGTGNNIKSRVNTYNEIWLRYENGEEHRNVFVGGKVETREGQTLTYLANQNNNLIVAVLNHSTKRFDYLHTPPMKELQPKRNTGCMWWLFCGLGISGLIYWWSLDKSPEELPFALKTWQYWAILAIPALFGIIKSWKLNDKEQAEEAYIYNVLHPQITSIFNDVLSNAK